MTTSVVAQPPQTFSTHETISMLIHAASKVGKSTLTATAPKPILVLDAEGRWKFIPLRKVFWDPAQSPPVWDGTWDACIVNVREWQTVQMVYTWVTQYQTSFVTIVIDSITELQRRCRQNMKGVEAMKIQDWGVLLSLMDNTIRGFRDLTLFPQLSFRCAVFVAETRENQSGKWVPYMQGQISVAMPYWVDVCGYLYPDYELDANNQPTREVRRLLVSPDPRFEAGERVQGRLGKVVTIPKPLDGQVGHDIEDMMIKIYGPRPGQETVVQ